MKNLIFAGLLSVVATSAIAFEGSNNPDFFSNKYNHNMDSLALEGSLETNMTPWSSSFWPHIYGGIAFRWNNYYTDIPAIRQYQAQVGALKEEITTLKGELFSTENVTPIMVQTAQQKIRTAKGKISKLLSLKGAEHQRNFFSIKRPTSMNEVRAMSQNDIDQLSATEKYDIYVALKKGKRLSTKLTKNVLNFTGPYSSYWEGVCNGWSSAAIEFDEPQVTTFTKDGVTINFGSSDLKALLSYYHSSITKNYFARKKTRINRIGERCRTEFPKEAWSIENGKEFYKSVVDGKVVKSPVPAECVDTNPGAFHIAMVNRIVGEKHSFVAEVVRDREVWNQPVIGFNSEVVETITAGFTNANAKTAKQLRVKTRLHYSNDGGRMFWEQDDPEEEFYAWWNPTNGTSNHRAGHKDFEYILDVDKKGNIIDGYWLSYERPDFIWLKRKSGFLGSKAKFGIVGYMDDLRDLVTLRD
jgi:hypothetical protein